MQVETLLTNVCDTSSIAEFELKVSSIELFLTIWTFIVLSPIVLQREDFCSNFFVSNIFLVLLAQRIQLADGEELKKQKFTSSPCSSSSSWYSKYKLYTIRFKWIG